MPPKRKRSSSPEGAKLVSKVLEDPKAFNVGPGLKKSPTPEPSTKKTKVDTPEWTHPDNPHVKLSPEANAAADKFLKNARETESKTTPAMDDLAKKLDAELLGRDYRLKGEDSLKMKLWNIQRKNPDLTPEQALDRVNDSVRYTVKHDKDTYTDGVKKTNEELKGKGFEPDPKQYKFRWEEGPGYKGINSTWVDPKTNTQFEVQHHTKDSFWAKDEGTHHLYDKMKALDEGTPEWQKLSDEQDKIFSSVPFPNNVGDVRNLSG